MDITRRRMVLSLLASVPAVALGSIARAGAPRPQGQLDVLNLGDSGRASLVEGETMLVEFVFPEPVSSVEGSFPIRIAPYSAGGEFLTEPQPLFFYPGPDAATWRTILSAPLDSAGRHGTLDVTARTGDASQSWHFDYASLAGNYRRSNLTLSRETTSPSPEIAERKRQDFEANARLFKERTPRMWDDEFVAAVAAGSKNNFGLRRTVNGSLHYRHSGLDYAVPIGTPVRAINDGRIAFSGEQWTPGQLVILDHGGGVFSRYLHLSERHVTEGSVVARGDVIGLSGNTGGQRPGPHLHLDTFVNGTAVSPVSLRRTAARLLERERATRGV